MQEFIQAGKPVLLQHIVRQNGYPPGTTLSRRLQHGNRKAQGGHHPLGRLRDLEQAAVTHQLPQLHTFPLHQHIKPQLQGSMELYKRLLAKFTRVNPLSGSRMNRGLPCSRLTRCSPDRKL